MQINKLLDFQEHYKKLLVQNIWNHLHIEIKNNKSVNILRKD